MMSKNLYIVRHAKAEQSLSKKDFDRILIDKGIERATRISKQLALDFKAEHTTLCISSPAKRAYQTAEIFIEAIKYPKIGLVKEESLYEASYLDILKVINQIPTQIQTAFIFGHNPGLSDFVEYVSNTSIYLKTSQVVQLLLDDDFDFNSLTANSASLVRSII
ncbi:histidine phosphatase family protein [Sphingobacterium sp. SRCM116780]|uniref:SixA phosphatase family protein n=1 Tax=Sphingobacterium sp. SRCM116780 TaxID=2907623 RepID=UPI001F340DF2|nr:histidine phosphatase family protein [Sphingobacterium sp. SRCM116780]UIR56300.1 histidine phosphatase family protein [Sphingobacterium sp. SRCM116780]